MYSYGTSTEKAKPTKRSRVNVLDAPSHIVKFVPRFNFAAGGKVSSDKLEGSEVFSI